MKTVLIITAMLICHSISAQDVNLTTPEATVKTMFQGMREGDSTLVSSTFHEKLTLHSVFTTKTGEEKIHEGSAKGFLEAVGTPHDQVWDERISDLNIQIDGNLAHAWMKYKFYLDDQFSHCGVNAMHLTKIAGEWKIFQLMDTRRKTNCE